MHLIFDAHRIPRTTTRSEWRGIWRWKRRTDATCKRIEQSWIACGELDKVIYSPVIIYPDLPQCRSLDLRPGALSYVG